MRGHVLVVTAAVLAPLSTPVPAESAAAPATGPAAFVAPADVQLSHCWSSDHGAPVLRDIQVTPTRVAVGRTGGSVDVVVDVVDTGGPGPASGIKAARIGFAAGGRGGFYTEADLRQQQDGRWRAEIALLPGQRGTATIARIEIEDHAGARREYGTRRLDQLGLRRTVLVTGPQDRALPVLAELRLATRTPDVRRHAASIPVRIRATDDLGVRTVLLRATHAATGADRQLVPLVRRSGSSRDGLWAGTLTIPRGARPGTWNLQASLFDNVENRRLVRSPQLAAAHLPSTLTVRSRRDGTPPRVTTPTVVPQLVDTRSGSTEVQVRVRALDEGSGVERLTAELAIPFYDDGQQYYQVVGRARMVRSGGASGVWEATLRISDCAPRYQYEQSSPYSLTLLVRAHDRAANRGVAEFPAAAQLATPDTLRPIAYVTSPVATTGPVIVNFSEPVFGLGAANVYLYRYDDDNVGHLGPRVEGTWSCTSDNRDPVPCGDGPLRTATFTPAAPLKGATDYLVVPNPEHVLSAMDAAGNPALSQIFSTR